MSADETAKVRLGLIADHRRNRRDLEIALHGARVIGTASRAKLDRVAERRAIALDHEAAPIVDEVRRLSEGGVVAAFDHVGGRHLRKITIPSLRQAWPSSTEATTRRGTAN